MSEADSWIAADRYLEDIVPLLKRHCNLLSGEVQKHLKALIEFQDSADIERRYRSLEQVLVAALAQAENDSKRVKELERLQELHFESIEFSILNLNSRSSNARKDFFVLKNQIDELQERIKSQVESQKVLDRAEYDRNQAMIDKLEKMREKMLQAVREMIQLNASKRDIETILKELEDKDRLKKRDVLGIIADISSLAGLALTILL